MSDPRDGSDGYEDYPPRRRGRDDDRRGYGHFGRFMRRQQVEEENDFIEFWFKLALVVGAVVAAVYFGGTWFDQEFGTSIIPSLKHWLANLLDGLFDH